MAGSRIQRIRRGAVGVLLGAAAIGAVPSPGAASPADPFTWRLLNTFIYEGTGWGPDTLNMEGGRANGQIPTGQISITDGQVRTWVASPLSPDAVELGTAPWRLEFGGNSVISRVLWVPGAYDPGTARFTPAPGAPTSASGTEPTAFVPSADFTLPPGANVAVRVTGAFGSGVPSAVDTYDEQGERSPSSLSYSGGAGLETEAERVARRMQETRCANRPTIPAEGCAETWAARWGGPAETASGGDLAVAPDGSALYVAGSVVDRKLDQDIVVQAYDAQTGALRWQDRFNGPGGPQDIPDEILVSPDGSTVYVTGRVCVTPTTGNLNCTSNVDIAAIAYDAATGARRWSRTFGGAVEQIPRTVAVSPDGSTLVVGGTTVPVAGQVDSMDVLVAALDAATGSTRWEATFGGASALQDHVQAAAFGGGVVYLAGTARSASTHFDVLILGYDVDSGQRVFERVIDGGAGGDDRANDVAVSGDTVYVTGAGVAEPGATRDALTIAYELDMDRERWRAWHDGRWGGSDGGSFLETAGDAVLVGGTEAESSVLVDSFAASYDPVTGERRWLSRFTRPGRSYDGLRDMAVSADGGRVLLAVEGGWFQSSTHDYVTLAYDGETGATDLQAIYDGPYRGGEIPTGIGASADGSRVFVTGASQAVVPSTVQVSWDIATLSYDIPVSMP